MHACTHTHTHTHTTCKCQPRTSTNTPQVLKKKHQSQHTHELGARTTHNTQHTTHNTHKCTRTTQKVPLNFASKQLFPHHVHVTLCPAIPPRRTARLVAAAPGHAPPPTFWKQLVHLWRKLVPSEPCTGSCAGASLDVGNQYRSSRQRDTQSTHFHRGTHTQRHTPPCERFSPSVGRCLVWRCDFTLRENGLAASGSLFFYTRLPCGSMEDAIDCSRVG